MSTLLTQPLPLTLTPQTVGYAALALLVLAPFALYIYLYPYTAATLPFKNLRGPAPASGLFGSLLTVGAKPIGRRYASLTEEYGASTARFLVGRWRIASTDVTAIAHVLRHTGQWHRNEGFNGLIARMTGFNVLCVEDEAHRRQRRILNSAFNGTSVGAMMPMFWEEAYDLKKNVEDALHVGTGKSTEIDMLQVYIRTAMDIIGRAGFNYYFEKHKGPDGENPLSKSFNDMINGMFENKKLVLAQSIFPQFLDLVSLHGVH
jgi:cytochrome P450